MYLSSSLSKTSRKLLMMHYFFVEPSRSVLYDGTMLVVFSFSYVTSMMQEIQEEKIHSSLDLANTTKSLPVFFSPVLCLCSTLEEKCMYKCLQSVNSL